MTRIYFSGIGGTAIGPLALIAHQAGYQVLGSDKQDSEYIKYLRKKGLSNIHIGQSKENIASEHSKSAIDWVVFSSAVLIENPNHPELIFAKENNIKFSKRDEFLNKIITDSNKKLVAIAGTHGKTTTTAMVVWLFKKLNISVSYSVGAKIPFGEMGYFDEKSDYFVYECDEFDRNFLTFHPFISLISGIDYDHHEIFPTPQSYNQAFEQFLDQTNQKVIWLDDYKKIYLKDSEDTIVLDDDDEILNTLSLFGRVNRKNALLAVAAVHKLTDYPVERLISIVEEFPGLSRRFEKISANLYSDYAHTIPKIEGCLQMAHEISKDVVAVYEPLTDRRQHHIKNQYKDLFKGVKKLYWVPSYLAREDPNQKILKPEDLIKEMSNPKIAKPAKLDKSLKEDIQNHLRSRDLVVCLSGGGGGSLDEWLRQEFKK